MNQRAPMLLVLIPLLVGVSLPAIFSVPLYCVLPLLLVNILALLVLRHRSLIYSLVLLVGTLIAMFSAPSNAGVEDSFGRLVAIKFKGHSEAKVLSEYDAVSDTWRRCRYRALYRGIDSEGLDVAVVRANVRVIDPKQSLYNSSLYRSGYRATIYITDTISTTQKRLPLPERMNRWAVERLKRLDLSDESYAIAAAMSLGRSDGVEADLLESYRRSGTSHLMALSGLHLSIVSLIILGLACLLSFSFRGRILSSLLSIIAVWCFVFMVGSSPSVQRAAWMFTFLQLSFILSREYNSLNSLFSAAAFLICIDPSTLHSLSFQLSFVAVVAIITLASPICKIAVTKIFALDFILSSLIISVVATLATAPLISYTFGGFSVLSPLSTLGVVLNFSIIIFSSLLWILLPVPLLAPLFRSIIEFWATLQNYIVGWFASHKWGYINYQMGLWEMVVYYIVLIIIVILAQRILGTQIAGEDQDFA